MGGDGQGFLALLSSGRFNLNSSIISSACVFTVIHKYLVKPQAHKRYFFCESLERILEIFRKRGSQHRGSWQRLYSGGPSTGGPGSGYIVGVPAPGSWQRLYSGDPSTGGPGSSYIAGVPAPARGSW